MMSGEVMITDEMVTANGFAQHPTLKKYKALVRPTAQISQIKLKK